WVVWPAPMVPLYGVLPWKSCGLTPQPCRHLGTYRHLSPPVDTSCRWGPWRRSPQRAWPAAQAMMPPPMVGGHRAGWRVGTEHALCQTSIRALQQVVVPVMLDGCSRALVPQACARRARPARACRSHPRVRRMASREETHMVLIFLPHGKPCGTGQRVMAVVP